MNERTRKKATEKPCSSVDSASCLLSRAYDPVASQKQHVWYAATYTNKAEENQTLVQGDRPHVYSILQF